MKKRIIIVIYISIFLLSLIVIRLGYITFYLSNEINPLAYDLWSREIPINSSRGLILDRNGKIIVGNELCYTVCSINKQVKDKEDTANKLASILGVTKDKILAHLIKNNSVEIIKPEGRKIDEGKASQIARLNISGIYLTCDSKRSYPYKTALAQVLGFAGVDNEGLSGIEYMYNDYLKSQTGALKVYTDAKGNLMHDMVSEFKDATPGMNITLTIDIELQTIMDNVITKAAAMYNPNQAMGLILDAKTGEVLAMSSYPFYDPSNYQDYSSEIINRNLPIFYQFELGSTFKIITYAAALELGLFDLNEGIYCGGATTVSDRRIKCWKAGGHGSQTFLQGIENECY